MRLRVGVFVLVVGFLAWGVALALVIIDLGAREQQPRIAPTPPAIGQNTTQAATIGSTPSQTPTDAPTEAKSTPTLAFVLLPTQAGGQNTPSRQGAEPTPTAPNPMPTTPPIYVVVTATPGGPAPDAGNAPDATRCAPPSGWQPYRVQPGDTLFGFQLGAEGKTDVAAIRAANCLTGNMLKIDQVIYLPPGTGEKAPKVDDSGPTSPGGGSGGVPTGARATNCPCTITIQPGWRLEQIAAAVDKAAPGFNGADFMAAVRGGYPDKWFFAGKPASAPLEGYMFPGPYTIQNGMTASDLRDMALAAFEANIAPQVGQDAAGRGMTMYQVVILASIIQRESRDPENQRLMGSLFHNRIARGMGLGSYVPLQYVTGGPGAWWPYPQAGISKLDTPYNTLMYEGFIPTPVDSPAQSAILAAVYFPQTDYLYVTLRCDGGGHFYTGVYAEFQRENECRNGK